jgi:hypothetical protein
MLQTLKEAIDNAMTDPTSNAIEWVHTSAEIVEGVESVLEVAADAGGTGAITTAIAGLLEDTAAGLALPIAGAAAGVVAEFTAIGTAYAEAARKIKKDRSGMGFAEGAVLGAWKAPTDFVKSRFFESSPEQNDFWPEGGVLAQGYYNAALVLGYRFGYELDKEETAAFWKDLGRGQDLDAVLGVPIPSEDSPQNDWVDFYIAAAARFHKLHIQDQDA